jgi:hypothetical protein
MVPPDEMLMRVKMCCLRCGDPARVVQGIELTANLGICCNGQKLVDGYKIDLDDGG